MNDTFELRPVEIFGSQLWTLLTLAPRKSDQVYKVDFVFKLYCTAISLYQRTVRWRTKRYRNYEVYANHFRMSSNLLLRYPSITHLPLENEILYGSTIYL